MPNTDLAGTSSDRFLVSGDLLFSTVGKLLREGERYIASAPQPVFDLSGAERCNSAGLALLLEWLEIGMQRDLRPQFVNLPSSLERIAKLSNVDQLLLSSN